MTTLLPTKLKADCAACCGLCCVALPFDAEQGFGFDKAAHVPCRQLQLNNRCSIHADLAIKGFPGCVTYDCYGAGQRVTQHLFKDTTWRASPEIAAEMFDAFRRVCTLHKLMAMLTVAVARERNSDARQQLNDKILELEIQCDSTVDTLTQLDINAIKHSVTMLLRNWEMRRVEHLHELASAKSCT